MSAVLGADIPRPDSEHAAVILGSEFPAQSESAWERYAGQLAAAATQLRSEQPVQDEIVSAVAAQSGQWADAALTVCLRRRDSLAHRIDYYALAAGCAGRVATALWATKLHMAESVSAAEAAIGAARAEIEPQISAALAVGDSPQASVLMQLLADRIQTAITSAQDEVAAESAAGTAAVGDEQRRLTAATPPGPTAATEPAGTHHPTLGDTPAVAAHQPIPSPAVELAGHHAALSDTPAAAAHQPAPTPTSENGQTDPSPASDRPAGVADPHPAPGDASPAASPPLTAPPTAPPQLPAAPHLAPMTTPNNPAAAGAGSPPSLTGTSTTSGGTPATAPAAGGSTAPPSTAAAPGGRIPAAAPAAVPLVGGGAAGLAAAAPSASSAGPAALGPVSSSSPGNLTPVPTTSATGAASTAAAATSAASAPTGHAVMSPAALGPAPLGAPVPPAAAAATPTAAATAAAVPAAAAANSAVPLGVPLLSGAPAAGGMDRTGENLAQAIDAATAILTACVAQARLRGWGGQDFGWGVAIYRAPTGLLTAWLATSYGPSYIPRGVRLPEGVRLVEPPPAAGGGDVLSLLVDQMAARSAAEPGARTLVLAATQPVARVQDWAAKLGAQAVSVDERTVTPAPAGPGGQHRCEAAMPWDWQQANVVRPAQRRGVAVHRAAAALAPVTLPACARVVEAIQRGHALPESAWAEAEAEQATARVAYNMAAAAGGAPGAAPLAHVFRVLAASDAALSLRDTSNEGLADVLYAARLAGAPLPSDEAADR